MWVWGLKMSSLFYFLKQSLKIIAFFIKVCYNENKGSIESEDYMNKKYIFIFVLFCILFVCGCQSNETPPEPNPYDVYKRIKEFASTHKDGKFNS